MGEVVVRVAQFYCMVFFQFVYPESDTTKHGRTILLFQEKCGVNDNKLSQLLRSDKLATFLRRGARQRRKSCLRHTSSLFPQTWKGNSCGFLGRIIKGIFSAGSYLGMVAPFPKKLLLKRRHCSPLRSLFPIFTFRLFYISNMREGRSRDR